MNKITNFKIKKLFGTLDVNIPIRDNKMVLVGANGTGKTTIIKILREVLSKRFLELQSYDFESLEITIDGESFFVNRNKLNAPPLQSKDLDNIVFAPDTLCCNTGLYEVPLIVRSTGKEADNFINLCNSYFEYTKLRREEGAIIGVRDLSFGERQIYEIFYRLLMNNSANNILIIDNPENSLSIQWQKRLLPDILATGKCSFIAAATHSPFIFENELDEYTEDIREYCFFKGEK